VASSLRGEGRDPALSVVAEECNAVGAWLLGGGLELDDVLTAAVDAAGMIWADIDPLDESKVSVAIDEEGQYFLQGEQVENPDAIEAGVAALLTGRTNESQRVVMFKCDRDIDKRIFEPVIEAINANTKYPPK